MFDKKNIIHESNLRRVMSLMYLIFPELEDNDLADYIPVWPDKESPWSILSSKEEYSIINQIKNLEIDFVNSIERYENVSFDVSYGPIYIHPSAEIGEYVRIEGPCFIGKNVEIRHSAYLRKGSWICDNSIVGHSSEIKNSVLLPGSKAPHFNYVGDSILGFNVNIGAGVKLSNVRNDRRNILVSINNEKRIDTGLRKFGALIGDRSEIGCNVVSNPGTILEPRTMISPNETLNGWVKND
ncbi:MAG: UDP-N-acetylglucosamine pyrophosphorylase [Candidatus Poseidoniales archaeon]|nr:MAG: UDP-N-acetylglucosamine pyrophosphorylase [Candidatus Poseidoniales archaeon]